MADKQISYQIVEFGAPLKEAVSPAPPPGKDEILVRVTHCGICHSDVHFQEGHFDLGDGLRMEMKATMKLPMTPGHEVVGVVEKTGADVKRVKVGDQVALYPLFGCKECSNCEQGLENLCNFQKFFGNSLQGGFSTHVLAKEEQAVPFRGINPAFAATCCCSGITTFSSIKRLGKLTNDDKILFIGAGGLGLMALQLFKVLYPSHPGPVFADIDQTRLDFVMSNGASEAINLKTDGKVVSTYMKMAWIGQGFTGILDFVGSGTSVAQCAGMLNKGGKAIIVGLFGGAAKVPAPLFPLKGITISGNFLGPRDEFEELFRILEGGKITPPPIFLRPLSDAPEALEELRKGKVVGRTVLKAEKGSSL